ncbi:MAG: polysaccharide pyruvyl transferase family protein [Ligilactobacillus salivarius]|nr:polysaccharide pyruvyl transferase family protein [Ligilactobacillus salivarius]
MRKVLVFAYFNKNIGDDLFVKILQDKYKNNYTFLVTSGTDRVQISENFNGNIEYYSKTMEKLDNLLYKKLGYMYFLRKIISKYSDIIIIGGSMFIQYKGWENKYKFYQELINEKTCIIGVNFGPFYDNAFLEKYRSLFEVASLVSFREKKSYDFFHS